MVGVKAVVVVGMEEEMEEKVVEKLVVEEMEKGGRPKEGTVALWAAAVLCCWLEMEKEERKKMKEREKWKIYIWSVLITTTLPST